MFTGDANLVCRKLCVSRWGMPCWSMYTFTGNVVQRFLTFLGIWCTYATFTLNFKTCMLPPPLPGPFMISHQNLCLGLVWGVILEEPFGWFTSVVNCCWWDPILSFWYVENRRCNICHTLSLFTYYILLKNLIFIHTLYPGSKVILSACPKLLDIIK